MEPMADVGAEGAAKADEHPASPPVATSLPIPAGRTGHPGAPVFPLASVAAAASIMRVNVGGANRSAASSSSAMPRASSFLSGGLAPVVPQEVVAPLSTTDEVLRRLWEAMKEVGQAVEPSFKV